VEIPDFGSDLPGITLRTAAVYIALIIGFRVMGKSRTGQLSTMDLIVILIISNAVQNAMVGENTSLLGGLLAAAVILVLDRGLHYLTERSGRARRALEGEPSILVAEGRVDADKLRTEGITPEELAQALRQNGLLTVEEARFVYLETTGTISVIPYRDGGPGKSGDPPRAG
jgi:uncharacterized membrane protein YcaP (DUF421 family)